MSDDSINPSQINYENILTEAIFKNNIIHKVYVGDYFELSGVD